jgi:predicted HTH domain antitoxin
VNVEISLPNDFVELQGKPETQRELAQSYGLWLYQRGRVTISRAAQLSGLDLYDFMMLCKAERIPTIDSDSAALRSELDALNAL